MCYKHIPKEYLRRKIIRIFRPNVFGSYFTVSFSAYGLQAPEVALNQELLHLTSSRKPIQDNYRFPYPLLSHPLLSAVLLYT